MNKNTKILIIGSGLAGSEAAFYLAENGHKVVLVDSKFIELNPAQKIKNCAELVCTNSLKSSDLNSAHGQLKYEMKKFNSLIINAAERNSVPAGHALAVNREEFSEEITNILKNHVNIEFLEDEVKDPVGFASKMNCLFTIIATGPLTNEALYTWLLENLSKENLYFYDAIAPVVEFESLDLTKLYFKDRYVDELEDKEADYLNCPLTKEEYELFINELIQAEKVPSKNFEKEKFFESCLPIDLMAQRGMETARFSCMKPVGLEVNGVRPYACVQLRKENLLGNAFNLVGFQTRLTFKEQLRVFKLLPGFENANFLHMGSVHRNTFINGKKILHKNFNIKSYPDIYMAGQISGVEGYTESAAIGLYVAIQLDRRINNVDELIFPNETAIGALVNYVLTSPKPSPSNINLGLFPPVELDYKKIKRKDKKKVKREKVFERARKHMDTLIENI